MDLFLGKLLAEFTVKQLWVFGVGSIIVVLLGLWIWFLYKVWMKEREERRYWQDQYVALVSTGHESLVPMSDAMRGVENALQETNLIIRERLPHSFHERAPQSR